MAKLIFEDNNKKQHEISINSISTKGLKPDDIIMIDAEIGQEEPKVAQEYMLRIRDTLQAYFPNNKIIIFAMRDGKKDINVKIVKDKKE